VTVTSGGSVTLETTSNGNISLGANIGGGSTTDIFANGTGTISQSAGTVSGSTVNLQSGSGDIFGLSDDQGHPLDTSALALTVNTSGSGFITNAGAVTLGTSLVGNQLQITTTGAGAKHHNLRYRHRNLRIAAAYRIRLNHHLKRHLRTHPHA